MTRLILIRHGQSQANTLSVFAGQTDSPLTELGMEQAERTAAYVAENYEIAAVYSSDLCRASAVGEKVAEKAGVPLTLDADLREIHAGLWEGCPFSQLAQRFDAYQVWLTNIGRAACDEGETVAQLQNRFLAALRRIAGSHPGKTVAIATHATPIRTLCCFCEKDSLDGMKDIPWVSNASVTEVICDNGGFSIVQAGFDGHLGESTSRFSGKV